jgi:hypothetical protein
MIVRFSCSIQKPLDSAPENRFLPDLALPHNHDAPTELVKLPPDPCVSRFVLCEFWFPKRSLRSGLPILSATVLVPEAPMDEDYLLPWAKDKIRIARQVACVQPVTVAHAVDKPPDHHFRLGVGISDTRHAFATLCRSQRIVSRHVIVSSGPTTRLCGTR